LQSNFSKAAALRQLFYFDGIEDRLLIEYNIYGEYYVES